MSKSKTEVTEVTEEPVVTKRTRKPSEVKPMYVIYKANEEGNDIDIISVTRKSDEVLDLTAGDPAMRFKRVITKL